MKYSVYKHTSPSGKVYIGITSQPVNGRWRKGEGYKGNEYFYRAITKYGWDSFVHEVLYEGLGKEEAEKIEIDLIAFYKSNLRRYGYNIENGGNVIGTHSQETKDKIAAARIGSKHTDETKRKIGDKNRGRIPSEETRRKMSETRKGKTHVCPEETKRKLSELHKGMKATEETRRKMSAAMKGKSLDSGSRVICLETQREFRKIKEAAQFYGVNKDCISQACRGIIKTAGGYHWQYIASLSKTTPDDLGGQKPQFSTDEDFTEE